MTYNLWLLLSMLALVGSVRSQEYHYQRPQVPFSEVPARHQQQPVKYVVQTLGPNSRTYDLESHLAPAIYENHQTVHVRGGQRVQQSKLGYGYQGAQQQFQVQQQQYVAPQQQLQYLPPQRVQQPQLQYSSYANPLLGSGSYQQFSSAVAAPLSTQALEPPAPPLSYYQPQGQAQGQAQGQPQTQIQSQPSGQYGVPQQQNLGPQRLYFANPHPYAMVTLPTGQQVLDAGHGSGVPPTAVLNKLLSSTGLSAEPAPRKGNHVAQSESASLDGYDYKQTIPGDTREYQRYVTNCQPNGQCQQQILSPGQVDAGHQQLLQDIRAVAHAHIEGCTKSPALYVPPGARMNAQGQLRPRNRRFYERREELLDRHPFN